MRITSATSIEARPFQYNPTPQAAADRAFDSGTGIRAKAVNGWLGRTWNDVGGGQNAATRPFFERFLEDQHRCGRPRPPQMTQAYPSDSDHDSCPIGPKPPGISTLRYPSDSDGDVGGKPPIHGGKPPIATLAYPSDSDHDSCPIGPKPPTISTLRYPSDSDHDLGGIRPT